MTGQKASAQEIDRLIETGESEQIFQKAILEQGRGHVRPHLSTAPCLTRPLQPAYRDHAGLSPKQCAELQKDVPGVT